MPQFCSKVKTATFTNEETGEDFDISVGDEIEIPQGLDSKRAIVYITFMFTRDGEVVMNCDFGFEISPQEIIAINGRKL